jgi:hypothetical protein
MSQNQKNEQEKSSWSGLLIAGGILALPVIAVGAVLGAVAVLGFEALNDQNDKTTQKQKETQKEIKDTKLKIDDSEDTGFSSIKVDESEVDSLNSDVPYAFLCPISQEMMREPVIIETGQTYERLYIESWLNSHNTCPVTGLELKSKTYIPNYSLRSAIDEWLKKDSKTTPTVNKVQNE